MSKEYQLDYLEALEAESIHILREVAAQFEKPALLFSGAKDSITILHLARKAFAPGNIPRDCMRNPIYFALENSMHVCVCMCGWYFNRDTAEILEMCNKKQVFRNIGIRISKAMFPCSLNN